MPRTNETPAALKAKIQKLQRQLESVERSKGPKVEKVLALMGKLGVTIADLQEANARRPRKARASTRVKAKATGGHVRGLLKYRDDAGNSWTGRGRTPRWLVEAEAAGKSRDAFLVSN